MSPCVKTVVKLFFCLLAPVFVAGCAIVPVSVETRVLEGRPFTDSQLDFIQLGATTRLDVIGNVGMPTIWLTEQRILVYGLRKVEPVGALWLIGAGYGGIGGLIVGETREAIFFVLDDDDIVTHWGRASVNRGETWLSAAVEWSRSEGLEIQTARDRFVEETPTTDRSLIYFYRPRDYQHFLPFVPPAIKVGPGVAKFADIRLDNELVGQIRWQSYVVVQVSPGVHEFVVDPDTDDVVNPGNYRSETIRLNVEPGTVTFVDVGIQAGYGVIEPILVQRPYSEAIAAIEELRESW